MSEKSALLSALSPEKLQLLIDRLKGSSGAVAPEAQPIARRPAGQDRIPLSYSQERLWFLDRLEPGTSTYNIPLAVAMQGELHYAALSGALRELMRRHEALRTTFEAVEGTPWQRVASAVESELTVVDLEGLPGAVREAEAQRLATGFARWSFDLEEGPLVITALLRFDRLSHRFLLVLHHIVGDGWSLGVLIREVAALYEAFAAGRPSPLPELPVQYPDFALWQRRIYAETGAKGLADWLLRLTGSEPFEMPTDQPRPAVQTYRGGGCSRVLSPELSQRLRDFGRSCEATLFMTLLALTKAVLRRHSGQEDMVVGSPIAGRGKAETEGLIGFFLNTLALRTNLSGDPSLRELAARVREVTLDAYSHQDVPFEALLAHLQVERDASRTSLFQVLFNMLNFPVSEIRQPGLTFKVVSLPTPPSKFDMTFYVQENEHGIRVNLLYNADLFSEARMADLLDQLVLLAEQAVENPGEPLSRFTLVTPAASRLLPDVREELDASWIGAVHELFLEQAGRSPERLAVKDGEGAWSYGDVDTVSSQIAGWLQAQGTGPGDAVAIYAHRSAAVVPAVLGALRAGAAFALLDPAYPGARLAEMLDIAVPKALLRLEAAGPLPGAIVERLNAAGAAVLDLPCGCVGAALASLAGCPAGKPVAVGPDSFACLGFTSGSTGRPKAIRGGHGSLSHFLPWHCQRFSLSGDDRFSLLSGLAHDPLQRDIFTPLFLGASILVPDPDDIGAPGRLAAWMARERVTVSHLTPAMAQLLTEGTGEADEIASLRLVLLVGDILTRQDVARIRALAPSVTCGNLYGATETQRALALHLVDGREDADTAGIRGKQVLPLGRGMKDVQLLVLNQRGNLAGVGELGEIAVRSPHLALGYLGDAALTAERFVINPFTGAPGDRLYKTGDLGRYLPNGEVAFAGRSDFQLKIRGFRIELGEVEATLAGLTGVREAVVVVQEEDGEKRLAAFVVSEPTQKSGTRVTGKSLREALRERLPAYMVPASFEILPSLPITPNGKVDRRALSQRARRTVEVKDGAVTLPRTPVEELLAGIWAEVLRLDRVGIHDDFFALGGHSLLATQVVARVRVALGVELPVRALFEAPTIAALGQAVEQMRTAGRDAVPPIEPVPRSGELPLSFAQQRLWFLDRLEPGSPAYNIPAALRIEGHLRVDLLARCLTEVVRRHEALRTTFGEVRGEPVQRIDPAADVPLPVVDLSALPPEVREGETSCLVIREALRPFDLARGPLLRASLLRLSPEEHAALLVLHHIVSDGWSMQVLIEEVGALYESYFAGRPSPLPDLPVQYADYAAWQRGWLAGEVLAAELEYWRRHLAGLPPRLELPTDRPRPAVQRSLGSSRPVFLDPGLVAGLTSLGRKEGATLFMVLLAGWQTLLGRYAGCEDLTVGTPVAGRTHQEIEKLIGFFVNTLVMRGDLSGSPGFRELLGRARRVALEAHEHQEVPFERLVEELSPERSLSHSPLFQVLFALQNVPRRVFDLPGLRLAAVEIERGTAKFDLSLSLVESGDGGLSGRLEYSLDLFEAATVERMLGHLGALLVAALANPELAIGELPLLTEAEQRQLAAWNNTASDYPRQLSLPELLGRRSAERPELVAVVCGAERLTYRELEERASRLAGRLRRQGAGPEVQVGVCLERSVSLVVALLAVWKAGGAYLPLDPSHPRERLARILADARPALLLTERGLLEGLPEHAGSTVFLNEEPDREPAVVATGPAAVPESLAYVIYTSGSTGQPKGVGVSHRSLVNFLTSMAQRPGLGAGDRLLAVTTLSFDIAGLEIWLPLLVGGCVEIAERSTAADGVRLAEHLRRSGATVLQATPTTWRMLLESGWEGDRGLTALCGGEALGRDLAERLVACTGALWNLYGPTETTVWSALRRVSSLDLEGSGAASVSLGRPIANTALHVVDRDLVELPVGVSGELCIGGDGLARGYLGRPDLTAERFVPDPFGVPGGRLYRTGDLVRRRVDGDLEFQGRIDHQVKLRGFRIEPGEVAAALVEEPGVREAVVVARRDGSGDLRLVAYVVADGPGLEALDLRERLRRRLPEYMVPSSFVALESLPLTPSGKIDRKALPAPERQVASGELASPRTPVEELLAGIWEEVLRLDRVGIHDDFFALGGHSLLATQVVARVRVALGVELPVRALFEAPTIAALGQAVAQARGSLQGATTPAIQPVPRSGELPLSFAQQRLWFLDRLEPDSPAYNIPAALRIEGHLRVDLLARCLTEVVRRHEALRTTFGEVRGEPVQRVGPAADVPLPVVDLSALLPKARERETSRLVTQEALRPLDLERGPLLRVSLLRLTPEEHAAFLTLHHIVSDGWSMQVLIEEVGALYEAYFAGRPSPLPDLPVQYGDYAAWQRGWLTGEVLASELEYWRHHLAGLPPLLELPTDHTRPAVQSSLGSSRPVRLDPGLVAGLSSLGRKEGATLFMVLLAGWQTLLGRYAGCEDLAVGTPVAGRTHQELERLIGLFVNTIVMRGNLSGSPSFRELLGRARRVALEAHEHQELPFERLVEELSPERSLSHSPLFQVLFVVQNVPRRVFDLPGLRLAAFEIELGTAKFDLSLSLGENGDGGLSGRLEYSLDLFEAATVERMLGHLGALLAAALANPERAIGELPLLTHGELLELAVWHRAADADEPVSQRSCLHELFASQAAQTPEAVAIISGEERLTYRDLDIQANRLAYQLRALKVGPEARVGVLLDRSPALVIGLLAVLKAGGAYVPLDPSYPYERLFYIVLDAKVSVLLTETSLATRLPLSELSGECRIERVLIDRALNEEQWAPENAAESAQKGEASADSLAYVIYTSGSTGRPKGTLITHANVVRLFEATSSWFAFDATDVWTLFHSYAFDFSVWELWGPLLHGGRLVVVPYWMSRSPRNFWNLLVEEKVTVLNQTPSAFQQLIPVAGGATSLRLVVFGGEALEVAGLEPWVKNYGVERPRLVNMYGITETTVHVTYRPLTAADFGVGQESRLGGIAPRSAIGIPIPDLRAYVLDPCLEACPIGVPGELCIGGPGLGRGYLNHPELTAARFVPSPFAGNPGERIYRSGDLARRLPNGELEYLGRIDQQVKVRGFRVELGEIEAALLSQPAVRSAKVVVFDDLDGVKRLAAYLVPMAEERPEAKTLRAALAEVLPAYMIPSIFIWLSALPLTSQGKVDRRALPPPPPASSETHGAFPSQARYGEILAEIWREILRIESVGLKDNFFVLGGDSILSLQLVSRAREAGLTLTPRQIFLYPTLGELAAVVGEADLSVERLSAAGEAPLTPIQAWFLTANPQAPHHFNQAVLLEFVEPLSPALLMAVLGSLLQHHDTLQLRFTLAEGKWRQEYASSAELPVTWLDLSALPRDLWRCVVQEASARLQASLDLTRGPLLRAACFNCGQGCPSRLLLAIHHLVVDGVSWRILLQDLAAAYRQLTAGLSISLPPRTVSYQAWARRLSEHSCSPELLEELDWWRESLDRPLPVLPVDLLGQNDVASERTFEVALSCEETRALLRDVPRVYRTRIDDALLVSLANALTSWTGGDLALVDLEGHGREDLFEDLDTSRTVGWFTAIYPVVVDLSGSRSPVEALMSVKEQVRAIPNKGMSYGFLRYLAGEEIAAVMAALPRGNVLLNYLGQLDSAIPGSFPFRPAMESAGPSRDPRLVRPYLIEINGRVAGERLILRWSYSCSCYRESTIERLAQDCIAFLRRITRECQQSRFCCYTPSDFPLALIDQVSLDELTIELGEIEDLYPLSPLQQGMLFQGLYEPESGVYVEQLGWNVSGKMEIAAFRTAWMNLIDRHSILRTAVVCCRQQWLQAVVPRAPLPWHLLDLRGLTEAEQRCEIENYMVTDQRRGFDLTYAPLLRIAVVLLSANTCRIIWSFHHLILDGWSLPILMRELFALYLALSREVPMDLPQSPPFVEYIRWMCRQDFNKSESFWRQILAGFRFPTRLVTASTERGYADVPPVYHRQRTILDEITTGALSAMAHRHQLTLNTLTQGAWALLLSRYSSEDDVLFGAVTSGRSALVRGLTEMIGPLINSLPVRVTVPSQASTLRWLHTLQEQQVLAREHEHTSLSRIQSWSEVERGHHLFESLLVFENYPVGASLSEPAADLGFKISGVDFAERTGYPLTLIVVPGDRLSIDFLYDGRRFDTLVIRRMSQHLRSLLEGMLENFMKALCDLPLLTAVERHQLIHEWNDTAVELPPLLLHNLFAAQAMRSPNATAVFLADDPETGPRGLTYAELDVRSNQLARYLARLGVGPDVPVAIAAERSLEMAVGLLGILKAGGAYVPLDPTYPRERLGFMLQDALAGVPAPVLLLQERLAERLFLPAPDALRTPVTMVHLDAHWPRIAAEAGDPLTVAQDPDHLAYAIYTSGSTGRPKGAMNTHRAVCNRLLWMQDAYHLTPDDRVLQKTPFSFDVSVWELFWPLITGARLVMARPEGHRDSAYLARAIADHEISYLHFVPSMLQAFLEEPDLGRCRSLRRVMASGEALPVELEWRFRQRLTAELHNLYGPTEAAVDVTSHPCQRDGEMGSVPIGRPIANLSIHLLDAVLQPAPVGVPGELYIGGIALARGYLGRPELTAERFVPSLFGPPGERLYRSGDLARRRADGEIEFLGRIDHQVKIRGNRIELGEIEAALAAHPAVREAVVIARAEPSGAVRLVAYVTAQADQEPILASALAGAADDLRAWLGRTLPDFMVPAAFVVLPALPLTPSGKVDRRALPAPERTAAESPQPATPRTAAEELVVRIWREVLRLDDVRRDDHFFALGGDSILSLQVVSRLAQAGYRVSPRKLFDHPTVAAFAEAVAQAPHVKAEMGQVTGAVPLTPVQHWFFGQRLPYPEHFNQALLLEVESWLSGSLLRQAIAHLLDHHDALRLRFTAGPEGWRQSHATSIDLAVFHLDLTAIPPERHQAVLQEAAGSLQASCDLASGPLLRAALFLLGDGRAARLLLVAHHLIVDGVSWRILLEDLVIAGRQLARGEKVVLPPKTSSFKSWAERLIEYAWSPALRSEAAFWQERLSRSVAPLPLDQVAGANDIASSRTVVRSLDAGQTRDLLHETIKAYRTQVDEVLLAALAQAVAVWTGHCRVLFDVENHGREEIFEDLSLARTVGWFTAIFPLLLELEEGASFGEVLKAVKEQVRRVPARGVGYGVARYLGPTEVAADLSALSHAEILFNYLGQLDQALPQGSPFRAAGESAGIARAAVQPRAYLLEIDASVGHGKLSLFFRYSAHRHRAATIEDLADRCLAAVRDLIAHCRILNAEGAHVLVPSDFPLAGLDSASLDRLLARSGPGIEDIYPLSPLQQGLLFDTLLRPGSGIYVEQLSCRLRGELDPRALRYAWERALERHAALRAAFFWKDLERPLQIVSLALSVPWSFCDLRGLSADVQRDEITAYLKADRARGFDLSRPPLLRLALFQLSLKSWRLVWSHHHLLLDGWSLSLLLREVFVLYAAACGGQEAQLSQPRPYSEYIGWLIRQEAVQAEAFWRRSLAGFRLPTTLLLPSIAHAAAGRGSFDQMQIFLDSAVTAELADLSRARQLTLNTLLQGAWALLLSRYSGERDVVFGAVTSGRSAPISDLETMIGLFINTLPVRLEISKDDRPSPWLAALQTQQAQAREHEHIPLVVIQGWSEVERGRPLFESLLVFENFPAGTALEGGQEPPGLAVDEVAVIERTGYPLTLVAEPGERLRLKLLYDGDRFDAPAVGRMFQHLENLLRSLASHTDQPLDDLPLLTSAECHQLSREWNDTHSGWAPHLLLHGLFAKQAACTPDAEAVVLAEKPEVGDAGLNYRELDLRSNQLARYLVRLGVGPDVPVAIAVERSLEMMVGLLGILKAGGAYVPLDPTYPRERLSFMLEDALAGVAAPILLSQSFLAERLPLPASLFGALTVLNVDADWPRIARESTAPPVVAVYPDHLAYVIYTSGSTGRPKGAMNTHRAICNRLLWMQDVYGLMPEDRVLQKTPFSFDVSVWELFWPLITGARLVMARPEGHKDSAYLAGVIAEKEITCLHFVPSMLQIFLDEPDLGPCRPLRIVMVSGEALPIGLEKRFHERLTAELHNLYGPTEAAVDVTFHACRRDGEVGSVPIGRPISNLAIYLLDAELRPVPIGVPGEVYIGGVGLARGYFGRPDLTAERFVPQPLSETPERLYRTGDLGRTRDDGEIEFLGRIDHQVKVRGFRIELGEIEAALVRHPAVRAAAVALHGAGASERPLVAYFVSREPGEEPDGPELRRYLAESLPEQMLPSTFMALPELPLTPSGKLDRRALPKPDKPRRAVTLAYVAPRSQLERSLGAIWQDVLKLDQVGIHDNFFDLGGHSLLVLRMQSQLRSSLGQDIALTDIFRYPTIAALAVHLSGQDTEQRALAKEKEHLQRLKEGRGRLRKRFEKRIDS